jgi:hypothetical protein
MFTRHTGVAALVGVALAATASAQQAAPVSPTPPSRAESTVNVTSLPVDVNRIQRKLQQQSTVREDGVGLNLRYSIDVYGRAPLLNLLDSRRDNLLRGPVPYGGPTHQQMLDVMTPQEFRAPVMDFTTFMRWLSDHAKK